MSTTHQKPQSPVVPLGYLAETGFPVELIQENFLLQMIGESLFPNLIFRGEAYKPFMPWQRGQGNSSIRTKEGTIKPSFKPVQGTTPREVSWGTEQWHVSPQTYGDTITINAASQAISAVPTWRTSFNQLGKLAGLTLDGLVRQKLWRAYSAGNAVLTVAASISDTTIAVSSINGWQEITGKGTFLQVSTTNPLVTRIGAPGSQEVVEVIGAIPDDPEFPLGKGTLILSSALTANHAVRAAVKASNRSTVIYAGGADTVDGITAANILTLQDIINGVTVLQDRSVPPCADGLYHVHFSPLSRAQIFGDSAFQNIYQSGFGQAPYKNLEVGTAEQLVQAYWYANTQVPRLGLADDLQVTGTNARLDPLHGVELINENGVQLKEIMIVGGEAIVDDTIPQEWMTPGTEAGLNGRVKPYSATANGVALDLEGIRCTIVYPTDPLQRIWTVSWSWDGDFGIPTDQLAPDYGATVGENPRHKRCVRIVTA